MEGYKALCDLLDDLRSEGYHVCYRYDYYSDQAIIKMSFAGALVKSIIPYISEINDSYSIIISELRSMQRRIDIAVGVVIDA